MPQLTRPPGHHDPFWDMDGKGARRSRSDGGSSATRCAVAVLAIAVVVTRLPTVDPQYLITGDGRPIMAGALLALLGSSILIALAWMRRTRGSLIGRARIGSTRYPRRVHSRGGPPMRTLITNGTIVTADGSTAADVLIDGETIAQIGTGLGRRA